MIHRTARRGFPRPRCLCATLPFPRRTCRAQGTQGDDDDQASTPAGRVILGSLAPQAALALDWEIERNFRYFLYASDVAAQRVGHDLYTARNGAAPTPEQLEKFMNGGGFWTDETERGRRSAKSWPIDWPHDTAPRPISLSSN